MENLFRLADHDESSARCCVLVGAGPSGLATAALLRDQGVPFVVLEKTDCIASLWQKRTYDRLTLHLPKQFCQLPFPEDFPDQGVPFVVLEKADCIASLWQKRTYDRLTLHLPKQFCQLPKLPFPEDFPEYPTKRQFIDYLEAYARQFDINPRFNECVQSVRYDETSGLWRVQTVSTNGGSRGEVEYICRWLIVATGENAECVTPDFEGLAEFGGDVMHACEYKSGEKFAEKKVLVVGCGNSGMELSLDLCNHNALPAMVIHDSVHVLPREVMGISTFGLAVLLMKRLPLWLVITRSSSFVEKTAICRHSKPGRKEISGEVGSSMRNNDLADHGVGQRGEAEPADQIAALIEFFESMEKNPIPLVECTDVPPNSTRAKVKRFYKLLKIVKMALIEFFESLEKNLIPLIDCTDVPPNSTRAKVKRFYKLLKIVKMGGQDINPRFRFAFALIPVALGAVKCGLLMYVLLGDMPWSIFFLYVVLIAFSFIAN